MIDDDIRFNKLYLDTIKRDALFKLKKAEIAMHRYASELPIGGDRVEAFEIYERIRNATRRD